METLLQDVRFALRSFARAKTFSVTTIALLALAIGACTAMFSVVDALLFRPLPFRDPDRLVFVQEGQPAVPRNQGPSAPDFHAFHDRATSFESMAAINFARMTLLEGEAAEAVVGAQVSSDYFRVLDGAPLLGRVFAEGDREAESLVVLGHGLWQRRFGSDRGIIGRRINLGGKPYAVVGVMPKDYVDGTWVDLWMLSDFAIDEAERGRHGTGTVARLKPGVSLAAADAEIAELERRLAEEHPATNAGVTTRVVPFHGELVRNTRTPVLLLSFATALVLLIACANVASLLLARASARRGEIAIRAALGATEGRIVRQLLTESALLALAGGALGLGLAAWAIDLLVAGLARYIPHAQRAAIDGRTLAFTLSISIVTALAFGLVPARRAARRDLRAALAESGARTSADRRANLLRSALVALEIALALVLLSGAGVLLKSFERLMSVDRGFDARGVTLFETRLQGDRFPDDARRRAFADAVLEKIAALPGVESAAAMTEAPLRGDASGTFEIEGRPPSPRGAAPGLAFQMASPGYAKTLGVKVQQGRFFDARDGASSQRVAVINATLARRFFPGESPIGKRLRIDLGVEGQYEHGFNEIVGVYGDTPNRGLGSEPAPETLFPLAQYSAQDSLTFAVRAGRGGADLLARLRSAVRDVDPLVPVTPIRSGPDRMTSYEQIVDRSVSNQRFYTFLLGAFAAVALVLAAVGVFGVVAYSVEQRRHELAIRLALGATPRDVLLLVLRQSAAIVAIGVGAGLAVAVVATRVLRSLVFDVSTLDLGAFSLAAALLLLVTLVASYLPARRATRISPMLALRGD